jgi:hypothetical protein
MIDGRIRKYRRHHPRKRMIQYSVSFRFQRSSVFTGYPLVIGLANGETRWRV